MGGGHEGGLQLPDGGARVLGASHVVQPRPLPLDLGAPVHLQQAGGWWVDGWLGKWAGGWAVGGWVGGQVGWGD